MANAGPLSIKLNTSEAKTAIPLISEGHFAHWKLAQVTETQVEGKGPMILFEWDLTQPAPNTDGGQIVPGQMGAKFFDRVTLYDKNTPQGQVPKQAMDKICKRVDALLGTGDPDNSKGKPVRPDFSGELVSNLVGKSIVAKMGVRNSDGYVGNEFKEVLFPSDATA